MKEIPCSVEVNRKKFNGSVSAGIQGVLIKKKGILRTKTKYFIPYSSIISVNLSKKLFTFRLKIVFHHGISVDEICIDGNKKIKDIYESINRMRLNSFF